MRILFMIKGNILSEYTDHQTPQTWEKWGGSRELVSCTGFSIQTLLDQHGNVDFKILIRFLENNQVSVDNFFKKKEYVKRILFPFFDFLHTSFSAKKHIPQNIIDILENHSSVREGILSYIEESTPHIKPHIDQYYIIDFHLFLLWMSQDFNLVKDIQLDHFIKISALFADSVAKVSQIIGTTHVWTSKKLPEILVRELNYCKQLGETINKLALIHGGNFEERQISFNLGMIIRTNINSLLKQLDSGFIEKPLIVKKLRNLSGKVQVNFEHGIPIIGSLAQMEEIASNGDTSLVEWFNLQKESDFWQDDVNGEAYKREKEISEIVLLWNRALIKLAKIYQIEKKQSKEKQGCVSSELSKEKLMPMRDIISIYSYATGKQLETMEEIFADILRNGIENEFQIESLYYILFYGDNIKGEILEKLMGVFLETNDQDNKLFYEQYEWGIKIVALIMRKFSSAQERFIHSLPLAENIYSSLKGKEVSHSVLNYSKVYLSLALYYIKYKESGHMERAQICFSHYKDLSADFIGMNENLILQDEKNFYIALWMKKFGVESEDSENLGKIVFKDSMEKFQSSKRFSIKSEVEQIITSMNHWNEVYSQDKLTELLGWVIAKFIFYNLCTITVIGDCENCKCRDASCDISLSSLEAEKCFLIPEQRGFWTEKMEFDWGVSLYFTYSLFAQDIVKNILREQWKLIEKCLQDVIATNRRTALLQEANREKEKELHFNALTGLPNKRSLLSDLKKLDSTKPFLLLLKFDQVTDMSDGWGFDEWDILIKEIAEMLKTLNIGLVYRTGGSEFAIIMAHDMENKGLTIESCTRGLINKIIKTQILLPGNGLFHVTPTIGIVQSDGMKAYDKAHTALQDARRVGMGEFKLYEEGIAEVKIQRELLIKSELNKALKTGQVATVFQWIRDNKNPNCLKKKYEALMRVPWFSPWEFIDVAKKHGLLPELMREVIKKTLQSAQWDNNQYSINITDENLRDPNFIEDFNKFLEEYNVPATQICIEITEDVMDIKKAGYMEKLQKLDTMGCEFSIDDFWIKSSGWDHLVQFKNHLKNFRYLKIDGSFIKDMDTNPDHYAIVAGTTDIAHKLGLKVIAEFVRTQSVQSEVEKLGIDFSQGYLFSEPAAEIMR